MTKHTPGPWRVDETKALGAYGVWTDYACPHNPHGDDNPCLIASVFPSNQSDLPREERDANARLIAAGPELLDLARNVVGFCVALRQDHECWPNHPDAGLLFAKATEILKRAGVAIETDSSSASEAGGI